MNALQVRYPRGGGVYPRIAAVAPTVQTLDYIKRGPRLETVEQLIISLGYQAR